MRRLLIPVLLLSLLTPAFARRAHRVRAYPNRVHTTALFPTAGSLAAQAAEADRWGLKRIQNDSELRSLAADGLLVPLPTERCQTQAIKPQYRFARVWTAANLDSLCHDYSDAFGVPLFVSSAVRPMVYQSRLRRLIGFTAAPPDKSVHPVGIAFDLPKRKMSRAQRQWMQWKLWYWVQIGRAIVEEERACFHVVPLLDSDASRYGYSSGVTPFFNESSKAFDPAVFLHRPDGADVAPDIIAGLWIDADWDAFYDGGPARNPEAALDAINDSVRCGHAAERL